MCILIRLVTCDIEGVVWHRDVHAAVQAALAVGAVADHALAVYLHTPLLRASTHQPLAQEYGATGRASRRRRLCYSCPV
mgnify:CR=1 FL=1